MILALVLLFEVLTNADVVKLVNAGLSPETIETKIAATETKFDTSTDALVALANDGVPDRVIRAMITSGERASRPPQAERPARAAQSRRYDVAIHSQSGRCDDAELRIDGKGVKGSRCRNLDFELAWAAIQEVCYDYGFRGTVAFKTEKSEHRVSTNTPAEAKKIVENIRANAPRLSVRDCD